MGKSLYFCRVLQRNPLHSPLKGSASLTTTFTVGFVEGPERVGEGREGWAGEGAVGLTSGKGINIKRDSEFEC